VDIYDPIGEFIRDQRLEQPDTPEEARPLKERIRRSHAFSLMLHAQHGPAWAFDSEVRLVLDGRERSALELQLAAALRGYEALERLQPPPPFVSFYLDIASIRVSLWGRLLVELPGVICWDVRRYLALAPLWEDEAGQELRQRLRRLPFTAGAEGDADIASDWGVSVLESKGRLHRAGIPLRYSLIQGLPQPDLPPARDVRDAFRRVSEEMAYGHGVHSRRARRSLVPLLEADRPEESFEERVTLAVDLARALEELPALHRKLVHACLIEGKSQAEAARKLGISQATVSRRLNEALKLLRQRLG